jgi:diketogulonate reductase-like aldo/keto reductase
VQVRGIDVPDFMYGTAWKESRTQGLVELALREGFRAIDTANQRKHYFEEAVGAGLRAAGVPLDRLFIQTKFTHRAGQDERLPYDEGAPIATQVAQSYESSIAHLGKIDSYVLHGPSLRDRLAPEDVDAWRAIEALPVALVGISNVSASQVEELVALARVPPAFVQNRCYASTGWDREVRAACARNNIVYQGFSLLTANRDVVQHHREVRALAAELGVTTAQLVFAFARQRGMLPLTGTTSAEHMRLDLASAAIVLGTEQLAFLDGCGV